MGGLDKLQALKNQYREQNGLPPLPEDPGEVCRNMRSSSPPASAADLIDQQIPHRGLRSGASKRVGTCNGIENTMAQCKTVLYTYLPYLLISPIN